MIPKSKSRYRNLSMFLKNLSNDNSHYWVGARKKNHSTLRLGDLYKKYLFCEILFKHSVDVVNTHSYAKCYFSSTNRLVGKSKTDVHDKTMRVLRRELRNSKNIYFPVFFWGKQNQKTCLKKTKHVFLLLSWSCYYRYYDEDPDRIL